MKNLYIALAILVWFGSQWISGQPMTFHDREKRAPMVGFQNTPFHRYPNGTAKPRPGWLKEHRGWVPTPPKTF